MKQIQLKIIWMGRSSYFITKNYVMIIDIIPEKKAL